MAQVSTSEIGYTARRHTRNGIEWLARMGYFAKGTVYATVGILTAMTAFGFAGGGITGFAQGSASISGAGRWLIGRAGGTGTARVNTSGTVAISQLQVGLRADDAAGTGTLLLEAGTINTSSWTEIGNGAGSTGTLEMTGGAINLAGPGVGVDQPSVVIGSNAGGTGVATVSGGTITSSNRFRMGTGAGSSGTLNLSGGTIRTTGSHFEIGRDGGSAEVNLSGGLLDSAGEFWVAQGGGAVGEVNLGAGEISAGSWTAVGREGGTGSVVMTGGTYTQRDNGDAAFIVGASGPGTFDQSGGLVNLLASRAWIGENANATYTLGGTGTMNAPEASRWRAVRLPPPPSTSTMAAPSTPTGSAAARAPAR